MSYLERIEIIGDIGSCELKTPENKPRYLKISVAANRKTKSGEIVPQWYQGYVVGNMAEKMNLEAMQTHFKKGRLIRIVGNPSWTANGDKVYVDIMLTEAPMLLDKQFVNKK